MKDKIKIATALGYYARAADPEIKSLAAAVECYAIAEYRNDVDCQIAFRIGYCKADDHIKERGPEASELQDLRKFILALIGEMRALRTAMGSNENIPMHHLYGGDGDLEAKQYVTVTKITDDGQCHAEGVAPRRLVPVIGGPGGGYGGGNGGGFGGGGGGGVGEMRYSGKGSGGGGGGGGGSGAFGESCVGYDPNNPPWAVSVTDLKRDGDIITGTAHFPADELTIIRSYDEVPVDAGYNVKPGIEHWKKPGPYSWRKQEYEEGKPTIPRISSTLFYAINLDTGDYYKARGFSNPTGFETYAACAKVCEALNAEGTQSWSPNHT